MNQNFVNQNFVNQNNVNQNNVNQNNQVAHNVNAFDLGAILPEYIVQGMFRYNNLEHRVFYDARVNARIPIAVMVYVNQFINPFMYFNQNFLMQNQATFGPHMYPRALNWYNYVGQNPDETTAGINAINQARLGYTYLLNDMINVAIMQHNHYINNQNNHNINDQNIIDQNNQNIIDQNNQNNQNIINEYNNLINQNLNNQNLNNQNLNNQNLNIIYDDDDNVIEH